MQNAKCEGSGTRTSQTAWNSTPLIAAIQLPGRDDEVAMQALNLMDCHQSQVIPLLAHGADVIRMAIMISAIDLASISLLVLSLIWQVK